MSAPGSAVRGLVFGLPISLLLWAALVGAVALLLAVTS
ncbi:hypothetical protein EV641_109227 [Rhodococcus sp. SMB37]|nr:hypothetical protein EV641_109227 [Rhodococcus sp. SMB37]